MKKLAFLLLIASYSVGSLMGQKTDSPNFDSIYKTDIAKQFDQYWGTDNPIIPLASFVVNNNTNVEKRKYTENGLTHEFYKITTLYLHRNKVYEFSIYNLKGRFFISAFADTGAVLKKISYASDNIFNSGENAGSSIDRMHFICGKSGFYQVGFIPIDNDFRYLGIFSFGLIGSSDRYKDQSKRKNYPRHKIIDDLKPRNDEFVNSYLEHNIAASCFFSNAEKSKKACNKYLATFKNGKYRKAVIQQKNKLESK